VDNNVPIAETTKVVEILRPLSSEDRTRVVRAAMALLGESDSSIGSTTHGGPDVVEVDLPNLAPRARAWMKQHSITVDELENVFHLSDGAVDFIAALPGRNKKEQTYAAYIVTGIGQLLLNGVASFDDRAARSLCERSGCYDRANHSAHLKDRGNEFTGTKEKGWTLTAPGLSRGAQIIKDVNRSGT
jgi:hypothetical protein